MYEFIKNQIDMMQLDELESYIEFIAEDESLSNKEYEMLYSRALNRLQGV